MVRYWCRQVEQADFLPRGSANFRADQSFRAFKMTLKYLQQAGKDRSASTSTSTSTFGQELTSRNQATQNQIAIMADGIDRKADERMEFTTSKDVT
jgi:hypothetical protein